MLTLATRIQWACLLLLLIGQGAIAQSPSLISDDQATPPLWHTTENGGDEPTYRKGRRPVGAITVDQVAAHIDQIFQGSAPWPSAIPERQHQILEQVYASRDLRPQWYTNSRWDPSLDAALLQIENAHLDALDPKDYRIDEALEFADARTVADVAASDLMLSAMILPYVNHMVNGRHAPRNRFDLAEVMNARGSDQSAGDFLSGLIPQTLEYQRLRAALAAQRADRTARIEIPLFSDGPYLRKGSRGDRVAELRHILTLTGDYLPDWETEVRENESEVPLPFDPALFDEPLHRAVIAFQQRQRLSADGIVGRGTRGALNRRTPPPIVLIKINMERLRWEAPLGGEDIYIRVNIPHYSLDVRNKGALDMTMPVIVGRRDRQTPLMSDRIVNLKFSPDWTVPSTIYREDILPELIANPDFAANSGYAIITDLGRVDAHTIDWSNPPPVTVYKDPSSRGPLGGVRFSLTNSRGIFLHDTNQRSLFDRSKRYLSSGCVRVGDAAALAHYLTQHDGMTREKIERAMQRGKTSWHEVNDGIGVPVFLSYMTAFIDEDGELIMTADPYQKDAQLIPFFDES